MGSEIYQSAFDCVDDCPWCDRSPGDLIEYAAIPAQSLAEVGEDELRYQIETDFTAYLVSTHEAVTRMKPGSDVVLIGSMSAESKMPGSSVYVAAKSGIRGFASALRKESRVDS